MSATTDQSNVQDKPWIHPADYQSQTEFRDRVGRRLRAAEDQLAIAITHGTVGLELPPQDNPFVFEAGTVLSRLLYARMLANYHRDNKESQEWLHGKIEPLLDAVITGEPQPFGERMVPSPAQEFAMREVALQLILRDGIKDKLRAEEWLACFLWRIEALPQHQARLWWEELVKASLADFRFAGGWRLDFCRQLQDKYTAFMQAADEADRAERAQHCVTSFCDDGPEPLRQYGPQVADAVQPARVATRAGLRLDPKTTGSA